MRIVFEPKVEEHEPSLYTSDKRANVINGWGNINEDVISQYKKEGYLIIGNAFTSTEVETAKEELKMMTLADDPQCESVYFEGGLRDLLETDLEKQGNTGKDKDDLSKLALGAVGQELPNLPNATRAHYVRKFMGFTEQHLPLKRLACHEELIALMQTLCGTEDIELFQEMAMIKPPGGREKPWHQDHAYFNYPLDTSIIGVWIALGDVDEKNGCMYLVPGAHKEGPISHFMKRDWQICDTEIYHALAGKRVCAPMKAGDVLIFDSKLPHGTPKNNTDEYRWAVQLHYKGTRAIPCTDEQRLEVFGSEGKNVSC